MSFHRPNILFFAMLRFSFLDFIWWFATKCLNNEMQLIAAFCIIFQIMELVSFFHVFFGFRSTSESHFAMVGEREGAGEWKKNHHSKWTSNGNICYVNGICCRVGFSAIWKAHETCAECVEIFLYTLKSLRISSAIKIRFWCMKIFFCCQFSQNGKLN